MEQSRYMNLESPDYYFNRELSWLDFNLRVLEEANDPSNPLLERVNFLSIGSSNLDEFFMIRVAGLQDQLKFGYSYPDTKTQLTADEQLEAISKKNRRNVTLQYQMLNQMKAELAKEGIYFTEVVDLNDSERAEVEAYFQKSIFPALTPLGIDAYRVFPNLNNKLLHLFVHLSNKKERHIAVVPISPLLNRPYILQGENGTKILLLEDIIRSFLDALFPGYEIENVFSFRITRNADFDIHEEDAEDLLSVIEDYLKQRKNGVAVRLEIDTRTSNEYLAESVEFLKNELELKDRDVYYFDGPLDLTVLSEIASSLEDQYPELVYPPFQPAIPKEILQKNIYEVIDQQDVFLHHPYDSFQPIVDFIQQAAEDEHTLAIKQTLYRVSSHSPIVAALKQAAENGIQVTVLVELKARFDEENNVHWAKELEESGANVLYGVTDLKTHSKISLVIKKQADHLVRYVHLGTGNYNDKTAKIYEDMGILTSNEEIAEDATAFFNYLSGYSEVPDYKHLYVSPYDIRSSFLDYIEKEIAFHKQYGNGRMIAKMNSLTDKTIIMKLYEASQVGVKIDLLIRGICCLRPGIKGVSENIRVRSIVGRFLEHSRIYYFHQNGKNHLFLSSADMMTRNMVKRVEIEFPVLDQTIRTEILSILDTYLADNQKARELDVSGTYQYIKNDHPALSAQEEFMREMNE
ncbi:RNA degradosome polyphosphate kinase [Jeotgalibaca caeni]|uniref:RNA degradosome polyphosphate kinase n=1 Tax=Jeotgalibaca caeni TaxID=3028623 RepID=UPI00237D38F9|nr:RNA degradosome polyphosphate kinase [Jeotgalibaca caeni]MDE1549044.1 RNA degradosome polyphosphate kinase [Jeotgalibaca caeni]